jgi:hypothetical protein
MFDRLSRSWDLVKASASVLKQDRSLLAFPAISGVAALIVALGFLLPLGGLAALDGLSGGESRAISAGAMVGGFLFYLCQYFVIFFFNTALVGAVMMRFEGGSPTVGDGLRIAASKFPAILGYAVIAATVGVILRAIQERVGFIGQLIVGLLGVGWTMATFLVVPVLAARDTGPVEAIKESAELLKRTWGENVIGQAGIGVTFAVIHCMVLLCGLGLVMFVAGTHSKSLVVLMIMLTIAALVITSLIQAALSGIYSAALYRYATDSGATQGFDRAALQGAFQPK